jgi:hypothetical protein
MRVFAPWILSLLLSAVPVFAENPAVRVEISTNPVRFLEPFEVRYTVPGAEKILAAAFASNDFASNSVDIRLKGIISNTLTVTARSLELSNAALPVLTLRAVVDGREREFTAPETPIVQEQLRANITNPAPAAPIYYFHDFSWLFLLLGAAVIVFLAVFFGRKLLSAKPAATAAPAASPVDPWEEARETIARIASSPMDEHNAKEQFAVLSEAVRRFLEHALGLSALELATSEIMTGYRRFAADRGFMETDAAEIREILEHIFRACDRVKFAKHIPNAAERDTAVSEAYALLSKTQSLLAPITDDGSGGSK